MFVVFEVVLRLLSWSEGVCEELCSSAYSPISENDDVSFWEKSEPVGTEGFLSPVEMTTPTIIANTKRVATEICHPFLLGFIPLTACFGSRSAIQ